MIPGTKAKFERPLNWNAEDVDGQLFIASAEEEGFILLSPFQMEAGENMASLQHKKEELALFKNRQKALSSFLSYQE